MMNNNRKFSSLWISLGLAQVLFILLLPVWLRLLDYLHPIVLVVVWMCVTVFVIFVVYFVRKETILLSKIIVKVIMGIYSLGLAVLLFFRPANQDYGAINLVPFKTIIGFLGGEGYVLVAFYNLSANILLFVPFGVVLQMFYKGLSRWQLVIFPTAVIVLIEVIQHVSRRGSMDIDDLILNLLGIGIGYTLSPVIEKVVKVKGDGREFAHSK